MLPNGRSAPRNGTYGIAVDEEAQELFLTVEHVNSVVVFRKMAEGEEKPIRTLQGDQTELEDPHGIAVDGKNNWVFVTNHGNVKNTNPPQVGRFEPPSITVHSLQASGDTPPLRVIEGPKTQLNLAGGAVCRPGTGRTVCRQRRGKLHPRFPHYRQRGRGSYTNRKRSAYWDQKPYRRFRGFAEQRAVGLEHGKPPGGRLPPDGGRRCGSPADDPKRPGGKNSSGDRQSGRRRL